MEVITNPDGFMERNKDIGFAIPLAIVSVAAILGSITGYITAPAAIEAARKAFVGTGMTKEQMELVLRMIYYSAILSPLIATFGMWLLMVLVLYAISGLFGGSGSFSTLAKLVAFSYIPTILLSPVTIYMAYDAAKYGMQSYGAASTVLGIAITIWQYLYWTYAVKNARNLPLKKSAIVAAIPLIVILAFTSLSLRFLATL